MSEWKEAELNELCTIVTDGSHQSPKEYDGGLPMFSVKDMENYGFNYSKVKTISENDFNTLVKQGCKPKINDILIAKDGSVLKHIFKVKHEPNYVLLSSIAILRPKTQIINPDYLVYALKSPIINDLILSNFVSGSGVPRIVLKDFKKILISFPELLEQDRIAEVLSSLDNKIELLQQQNNTLEKLAETLFRQWFIENVDIPKGMKLKDYVDSANTGLDAIKRAPIVEKETGIKCLRIQDVSQSKPFYKWGNSEVEENNYKRFKLTKGDIIMARTCTPGINYFVREDLLSVFNNGLVRIRANKNKVHPIFLYQLFKTRDFIGHIDSVSGGTSVQLNMQIGDLLDYDFTFINKSKQDDVVNYFLNIDEKILYNQKQIEHLETLRDTLLPKLMSGAVRVEN